MVESSKRSRKPAAADWRKWVFDVVEPLSKKYQISRWYNYMMVAMTLLSFVPLLFHDETVWPLLLINVVCAMVFIADYAMRFMTADLHYKDSSARSFVRYAFSLSAIVDLLVILSVVTSLNSGFRLLRAVRLLYVVRIFQHSRSLQLIKLVLERAARPLLFVVSLALIYIFMVAAIMFNEEPELFPTFIDALYFAVISLATIGYGDIVPTTEVAKIIMTISTMVGILVFALPASVITAEYVSVVNEYREGKIDGKHHKKRFRNEETELIADAMNEEE